MKRIVSAFAISANLLLLPNIAAAEQIKIALPVNSLESLPIYVAEDNGIFKKHGLDIDVITSRGGGEAMKAYLAGDVQIVATGFPEVGLMRAKGTDVMLYFAQTSRVPFSLIAGNGINAVADLKGKTIAVTSPGSLTWIMARYFVKQAGLDPDRDVSLVSVGGGGEILGALKSGHADAAMLFEPFPTIAAKTGLAHVVLNVDQELDAFSSSPLATSKAFLEKSPQEAKDIFDALAEAQKFIRDDKAGAFEIAKKRFPSADPEVLKAALEHMYKVYSVDGKFTRANVRRTERISVNLKIMPKSYPYDEVVAPMARE